LVPLFNDFRHLRTNILGADPSRLASLITGIDANRYPLRYQGPMGRILSAASRSGGLDPHPEPKPIRAAVAEPRIRATGSIDEDGD
jgi:hypothetical protein